MSCNQQTKSCGCNFNTKSFGLCDVSKITLNGADRTALNWNEVSIPEIMEVPALKPSIEHLDQVYITPKLSCVKLIETPFAYDSYDRLATAFEIQSLLDALTLFDIDLGPITDIIEDILNIPGLPNIPAVAALQAALNAVLSASTNLTNVIGEALAILNGPCVIASVLITLIKAVEVAAVALRLALTALLGAANLLVTATAGIPIVGAAVAAAVALLTAAVNLVLDSIDAGITALLSIVLLVGDTKVLVIKANEEGTCLTGRKLIVEGELQQKIVYTALVQSQSVHSVHKSVPFNAYIVPYASFEGLTYSENITVLDPNGEDCETLVVNGFLYDPDTEITPNLCEQFEVNTCIEDIFAYAIDERNIFKNITLFLSARSAAGCNV